MEMEASFSINNPSFVDRESIMDDGNGRMSFERASHIIAMRSSTVIADILKEDPGGAHKELELEKRH
jgi:hypothetical protein